MVQVNSKRIIKNTIFLYTKTILSTIVIFLSTRIVLNALGEVDYGVYGVVGGVIAMLGYINIAMASATQRFMNLAEGAENKERSKTIFNNAIILHLCIGVAVVIVLELLYYWMFHGILNIPEERIDAAKIVYHMMVVSTFFTMITVPYEALINAHEDFLFYSIIGIIDSLLRLAVAYVIVYYTSDKLVLYGLLLAMISISMMIAKRIFCRRKYEECTTQLRQYGNKKTIKEISSFAGWNFVGVFASMAGNYGSTILMNHFFGAIVIAAKNIGDQIGGQLSILTSNLTSALTPSIIKSEGGGERKQMVILSLASCRLGFLLYSSLAIPFLFKSEYILGLWLKHLPEWTVLFCQLQVLRTLIEQLFSPLKTMLIAEGSIKSINIVDLILGILTFAVLLILYIVGLPAYWHYVISIILMVLVEAFMKFYYCRRFCGLTVNDFISEVLVKSLLSVVLTIVTCIIILTICSHDFLTVCLMVLASFICIALMGLSKRELQFMLNIITRKNE